MPVSADELIRLLSVLAEEENLRVTVKETMKAGVMAGTGATIGGLMGGPLGIAVGSMLGAGYAKWKIGGKTRSVSEVLTELDSDKRADVHKSFQDILDQYPGEDFSSLMRQLSEDGELRAKLSERTKKYVTEDLKLTIQESHKQRGKAE
ncbi:protein C19orf12 homolog isoform X1 [Anneissia japonica]|uniref:protein C19orf12 homolog isoform X1 n=1 Tax=Anneissia japonica TaxID=1529436 RepID=UPI00142571C3|nr:protein C19orf12 homolog isoform X1 [Anneissia japonica]XP_033117263.1 protein C19orf12 homolog isoform X1 [Anneissia japonica]XP_033117264.1 protein C19orf12 homolog isoform X1 [Anneissia japonica]